MGGPIEPWGTESKIYFAILTYVSTHYCFFIPLHWKSELCDAVTTAIRYTIATFGKLCLFIHSYIANYYEITAVREAFRLTCTFTHTTIPYNHQESVISEHENLTLLNGTDCVLATSELSDDYVTHALVMLILENPSHSTMLRGLHCILCHSNI